MVKRILSAAVCAGLAVAHADPAPQGYSGIGPGTSLSWTVLATLLPMTSGILIAAADANGNGGYVPIVLFAGGLVLGPSTGEFVSGYPLLGWGGAAVRAGGLGLFLDGISRNLEARCQAEDECDGESHDGEITLGAAMVVAGTLFGLVDAIAAPIRRKEAETRRIGLSPTLSLALGGTPAPGILAWMRF